VRTVGRDDTVRLGEHRLPLLPPRGHGTDARCRVEVREHLDGSLSVWHHGSRLATQAAPLEAPLLRARSGGGTPSVTGGGGFTAGLEEVSREALSPLLTPPPPTPISTRPAATHPWRRSYKGG